MLISIAKNSKIFIANSNAVMNIKLVNKNVFDSSTSPKLRKDLIK